MKDRSRDSNFFRRWLNISIREIPVPRVGLFLSQENKAEQTLGFLSYQDFSVAFECSFSITKIRIGDSWTVLSLGQD